MKQFFTSNKGFTLVEMVVVCLLFTVVLGITSDAFNRIVSKTLSLNRGAESNIRGVVGLELLRSDLQAAGYGLFWRFPEGATVTYQEATAAPGTDTVLNAYSGVPNSVPKAIGSVNNISSASPNVVLAGTDVIAIRGQTVAANAASKCWSYVESQVLPTVKPNPVPHAWQSEQLQPEHKVIMLSGIVNMSPENRLIVHPVTGVWNMRFDKYSSIGKPPIYNDVEKKSDAYVIYGVSDDAGLASLRMPFNRADYYVRRPDSSESSWMRLPERCNPATGLLVKGIVSQSNGSYTEFPVLDCVLDLQAVYSVQNPPGSGTLTDVSDISALTPQEIRDQVKEIKVYLLTHDGARDKSYRYPNATIGVGPGDGLTSGSGSTYDFAARAVPDWQNYRWRVYQIVARPSNLAGTASQ